MAVALEEIERVAKEEAGRGWEARCLTRARQRVGDGVVNWLAGMMEGQGHGQPLPRQTCIDRVRQLMDRPRSSPSCHAEHVFPV